MSFLGQYKNPTNMRTLSEEKLNNLKCNKCNNLLSVPPITLTMQGEYICGRCSPNPPSGTRLTIYETLAQDFLFPCQNSKHGCEQVLKWEDVRNHEKTCNKRPYLCPMSSTMNCLWRGSLKAISNHLSEEHLSSTKDVNIVKVKVNSNLIGCKLLHFNEKDYLFHVRFVNSKKSIELALVQLEHEEKLDKYRFKLFSEDLSKQILLPVHPVFSYAIKRNIEMQDGNCIGKDVIAYVTNDTNELYCEIVIDPEIEVKPKQASNENNCISNILECPVCNEFMRSPIFQCQTGHSFCFTCTPALRKCPLCKEPLQKTRNFALEEVANRHVEDCKNKSLGCDFKGFPSEVRKHESNCRIVYCSEEGCIWTGSEIALTEHSKAHEEKLKFSKNETKRTIAHSNRARPTVFLIKNRI